MNIEMLRRDFSEILECEKNAERIYTRYISRVDDVRVREVLEGIVKDEKMHIELARDLMEMCDNGTAS